MINPLPQSRRCLLAIIRDVFGLLADLGLIWWPALL